MKCVEVMVGNNFYVKRVPEDIFYARDSQAVRLFCKNMYGMDVSSIRYL